MPTKPRRSFLRDNGLCIVLLAIFLACLVGHAATGYRAYNDEQEKHGQSALPFGQYLRTGQFWESVAENWESEFLQMAAFVVLACHLYQRGSSESKDPDKRHESDQEPENHRRDPGAPWPVRRGGWVLKVYKHSLSLAFLLLFLISLALHAEGGLRQYNDQQEAHHRPTITYTQYITGSRFWFESFQNWQSEFLAILCMVVFSIFLRQHSSPQSKAVASPHWKTIG